MGSDPNGSDLLRSDLLRPDLGVFSAGSLVPSPLRAYV
jgi:hypothetical protein